MTKEKFLYEYFDKCVYIASLAGIAIENYTLVDNVKYYVEMLQCFEKYKEQYEYFAMKVETGQLQEEIMDARLMSDINWIRHKIIGNFITSMQRIVDDSLAGSGKEYDVKRGLLYKDGKLSDCISEESFYRVLKDIRRIEGYEKDKREMR